MDRARSKNVRVRVPLLRASLSRLVERLEETSRVLEKRPEHEPRDDATLPLIRRATGGAARPGRRKG